MIKTVESIREKLREFGLIKRLGQLKRRYLWAGNARRERRALIAVIASLQERVDAHQSFSRFDKSRTRDVRAGLRREFENCRAIQINRRNGSSWAKKLGQCRKVVGIHVGRFDDISALTKKWRATSQTLATCSQDLIQRSAAIPGAIFEKDVEFQRGEYYRSLDSAPLAKQMNEVESHLFQAGAILDRWESLLLKAERTRSGIAELETRLSALSRLEVAQDSVTEQTFEGIESSLGAIREMIKRGNYIAGHNLVEQNSERLKHLTAIIDRRHQYAREEIDLWAKRPSISERYDLASFSRALTPDEIHRWRVMREEIEVFVFQLASNSRKEHASAFARNDNRLKMQWSEAANIDTLERFSKGVADNWVRKLPGEKRHRPWR
jgi:hypothetical protein